MRTSRKPNQMPEQAYRDWLEEIGRPEPTTKDAIVDLLRRRAKEAFEEQDWRKCPTIREIAQELGRTQCHLNNLLLDMERAGRAARRKDGREWRWLPTAKT